MKMESGKIIIIVIFTVLIIGIVFIAFAGTGVYTFNIERSYEQNYNSCLNDKQVVNEQLQFCKDLKGIKDDTVYILLSFFAFLLFLGGLIFIGYNNHQRTVLARDFVKKIPCGGKNEC